LFREVNGYDLFYNRMLLAYGKGYHFLGYVILPNHVHFNIRVSAGGQLSALLANGKRFMA
jgi:hypothetical protein